MSNRYCQFARSSGFTLTELAVVLVIVALLIGGMLMPLTAQDDLRRTQETQKTLEEVRDALLGFATANGRLPCPDTDQDGVENILPSAPTNNSPLPGQSTQTTDCAAPEGDLPFASLGTGRLDGWGRRFRFRVTAAFGQRSIIWSGLNATGSVVSLTPGFTLSTAGDISIQTRGDDPATPAATEAKSILSLAANVPAAVISHGKNGYGARSSAGNTLPAPPPIDVDETTNASVSQTKISRTISGVVGNDACSDTNEGLPPCEFDDIVVWLSPNILYNRMIAAGRLP
jgi:prepilin-type N-terminal cleavage/methylation domain-containing protein